MQDMRQVEAERNMTQVGAERKMTQVGAVRTMTQVAPERKTAQAGCKCLLMFALFIARYLPGVNT